MELPGWVVGYLYGWWPHVPLTLVLALAGAFIVVYLVRDSAGEYDTASKMWHYTSLCWPVAILGAIVGFLLWPVPIIIFIILLCLCFGDDE